MLDFYSQGSAHTRSVAFLHSKALPTWPEVLRESRFDNAEFRFHKASSRSPLSLFVAGLPALSQWRRQKLVQSPAKQIQVHGHS